MNKQSNEHYSNSILTLIHDDSNNSLKILHDDINSINTRLTLLIGFNATFASLLSRLPMQKFFSLKDCLSSQINNSNSSTNTLLEILLVADKLFSLRSLTAICIGVSIFFAINSLLPKSVPVVIKPNKLLKKVQQNEQGESLSEEELRKGIIDTRDKAIKDLTHLIDKKASKLKRALIVLGIASILTVLSIIFE